MAVTFGDATAPSQRTTNLDALFSLSVQNVQRVLVDEISTSMALMKKIQAGQAYQGQNGGTHIEIPLMYALGTADTYSGYDVLDTSSMDGITRSIWEWAQIAIPISISRLEERQNAQKILDLLEAKITQASLGIKEFMPEMMLWGNVDNGGTIEANYVSPITGASGVNPIPNLVQIDPTNSETVGNINQSTSDWWRNQQKSSSATTTTEMLQELENIYNTCSNGVGGTPDLLVTDQDTFELLKMAIWKRFQHPPQEDAEFPFDNFRFRRSLVVYEEKMIDGTKTPSSGKGTMYLLNTQFIKVKYDTATNFITTPFQKPPNQDARVAHILWMGQLCISNRRKHGVWYNIPRSSAVTID